MDSIIRSLTQWSSLTSHHENQLCVILSNCIKFMKNKTTSSQGMQSLYEGFLKLYPQNHSPFTIYLLDKLLIEIIINDLESKILDFSKLSTKELFDATFHQYLLASIITKVKAGGYIPSDEDSINEYLCQRISLLSDGLEQYTLKSMTDITRQNHLLVIKLYKTLQNIVPAKNSIVKLLEDYYTKTLKWILSAIPPSNINEWMYFSQMLKKVSMIQTKRREFSLEDESKFCDDFLELFFENVTHLVLHKSDLCGNISEEKLIECNHELNEYLMDKQTGRRLVLSIMQLICYVTKKCKNEGEGIWGFYQEIFNQFQLSFIIEFHLSYCKYE